MGFYIEFLRVQFIQRDLLQSVSLTRSIALTLLVGRQKEHPACKN